MNNFFKRSITGILFVVVIVAAVCFHALSAALLFFVIVVLTSFELCKLLESHNKNFSSSLPLSIAYLSTLIILLILNGLLDYKFIFLLPLFPLPILIYELYSKKDNPIQNIAYGLLPTIYIALPFSLLYLSAFNSFFTVQYSYHYEIILGFFCMLWASDTGAYVTGLTIGKHKLFERISPKKTWEGSIGGGIFSIIAAVILSRFYPLLSMQNWIIISVIIVIFGNFGDLVESMFKRSLNIKDSGSILPGHGGLLDRFDGLLISAPVVFLYLLFISNF